ncbi:hypothetical protein [Massilia sp. BSC265]|uniref:hypothetical protein n=1 Tax=Massilia sp. BSC265 TaxID=1549812 RepID=UPI0004E89B0F|nr:hypothetical protein [Massilia sp. BSC265]KFI07991.1 hypothetical protein JN27_06015 [Massilia sp. BSC265]
MNKPPSLLSLFLVLAALALFGFIGARYMLSSHTENTNQQLGIVWPGLATMPEADRAFLVELAHTCNLTTRQPVRAEVVDCLRSVQMTPQASARLDRLIGQAPAQQR